jgi:hypothetical protein
MDHDSGERPRPILNDLRSGSPIGFFIAFLLLVVILLSVIKYRGAPDPISRPIHTALPAASPLPAFSIRPLPPDHWSEITIPPYGTRVAGFKYPSLFLSENITDAPGLERNLFLLESVRFVGIDPYSPDLTTPRILVVGANTAVGSAVCRLLGRRGIPFLPLKGSLDFDFSSVSMSDVFTAVRFKAAIVVFDFPKYHFAKTHGTQWITEIAYNYTDGLGHFLDQRSIPFIFGIVPPYLEVLTSVDFCFGGKLVFLPTVVDFVELYAPDNLLVKGIRDCRRSGKSRIELGNWSIDGITADQAAEFLVNQLSNFSIKRVFLTSTSQIPLRKAIERIPNCNITFVEYPHPLGWATPPPETVSVDGDVSELVNGAISNLVEKPASAPYLSIILTGRNDAYLNNFNDRVSTFFKYLDRIYEANPTVDFEIVFVDYASPSPSSLLKDVIQIPASIQPHIRWVIVPQDFALEYRASHPGSSDFHEYAAKNIGVRRAKGQYVLTMNPDSLLSYRFFEVCAERSLNPNILYLAARYSIIPRLLNSLSLDEIVQLSEEPWSQRLHKLEDFVDEGRNVMIFRVRRPSLNTILFRAGTGDFIMLSRDLYRAIQGFHETEFDSYCDHLFLMKMGKLIPGFIRCFLPISVMHQWHGSRPWNPPDQRLLHGAVNAYFFHGRTDLLPATTDSPDWGAPNQPFEILGEA